MAISERYAALTDAELLETMRRLTAALKQRRATNLHSISTWLMLTCAEYDRRKGVA